LTPGCASCHLWSVEPGRLYRSSAAIIIIIKN